jgi:hypothetical protein
MRQIKKMAVQAGGQGGHLNSTNHCFIKHYVKYNCQAEKSNNFARGGEL